MHVCDQASGPCLEKMGRALRTTAKPIRVPKLIVARECAQQAVPCRRLQVQALLIAVDDVDIRGCRKHISGTRRARPRHRGCAVGGTCVPLAPSLAGLAPAWAGLTCRGRASSSYGMQAAFLPWCFPKKLSQRLGVMAAPMPSHVWHPTQNPAELANIDVLCCIACAPASATSRRSLEA